MNRFPALVLLLLCGVFCLWTAAAADPAQVNRLIEEGKLEEALAAADQDLAAAPDDVTMRFMKGLVLTRMNRLDEAAAAFEELTEEHPELPEPYNNLAVVYAAKGDFDRARQSLQKAINTHPSYSTAHENMGDIYAKMASQAYNQALELDEDNPTAKAKLALINNLFSLPAPPAPTAVAAVPEEKVAAASAAPEQKPAPVPAEETPPAPAPEAPATARAEAAPPPVDTPPAQAVAESDDDVRRAVDLWATAWSAKDFNGYVGMYAADFAPEGGESRAAWQKSRRERITRPAFIKVEISDLRVTMLGADHAQAVFTQGYQSDTFSDRVKKTLILKKSGEQWLITQETSE